MSNNLKEAIDNLTATIKELITETKNNTIHSIKLRVEVEKSNELQEKHVKFLQRLVTNVLKDKKDTENTKLQTFERVATWVIRIVGGIAIGYLTYQSQFAP